MLVRTERSTNIGAFVPADPEPSQIVEHGRGASSDDTIAIEILDAEHQRGVVGAGRRGAENGGRGAAEVQLSCGRWRESAACSHRASRQDSVAMSLEREPSRGKATPRMASDPHASTVDDLHVELSWSGATSDLDLHLAVDDAELFSVPGDTSWCNPAPDWGAAGDPVDDGHLDLDDDDGFGPEHIGVDRPADGVYLVRVHHFDDGEDGDVTANVAVYARNALVWSGSRVLARNEVWDVGQVNWPGETFGAYTTDPWDAEGVRECR